MNRNLIPDDLINQVFTRHCSGFYTLDDQMRAAREIEAMAHANAVAQPRATAGVDLLCPFCGDDGEKGRQVVTQMNEARTQFTRITCRCCGAMAPELNWNSRMGVSAKATGEPQA